MPSFAEIEAARRRIGDTIYRTPCAFTQTLSDLCGCKVYLKLENLQMTGSFKERGAANKMHGLTAAERDAGVLAASAGNHAQGVAYMGKVLGIDTTIVMPVATPIVKVSATRAFGATVILHGTSYDEAYAHAREIQAREGKTFVHPFDDELVMAGQGTIGLELLEQNPYLDAIVVPVGGGGLIAGIAVAVKETNPKIKVYGVESEVMPAMKRSLEAGEIVTVPAHKSIADGIAVKSVGERTFEVARRYVDDVALVGEGELAQAILLLLEKEKTVVEGAGAAPLAALLHRRLPLEGKRVALVLSGGNIDVNVISRIIERGLASSGRTMKLQLRLQDLPGALLPVLDLISRKGANIRSVRHDRMFLQGELGQVLVGMVLETRGFDHVREIEAALTEGGYHFE